MILQLPGVSSSYQMFSGKCAESGFYTEENYQRGLNATAAFTALIHGDEDFSYVHNVRSFISTWSIADWLLQLLAINEPEQDAVKTPGLGDCQFGLISVSSSTNPAHLDRLQALCGDCQSYGTIGQSSLRSDFPRSS